MTLTLAEFQSLMQRAILAGDDAVLDHVPDGARERKDILLGVYRYAYTARLTEVLEKDFEFLRALLGGEAFAEMARAYIAAHPSDQPNARWFSRHLPGFLRVTPPWQSTPHVAELAALEHALGLAFDAADAPVLAMEQLAAIPPGNWGALRLVPHPSASRLTLATNATALWLAFKEEEEPPAPTRLAQPGQVLVWRSPEAMPMWRVLSPEETMMWDEAAKGVAFGVLCEMLATYDDPETAPARAAQYLSGWIASGLLRGDADLGLGAAPAADA